MAGGAGNIVVSGQARVEIQLLGPALRLARKGNILRKRAAGPSAAFRPKRDYPRETGCWPGAGIPFSSAPASAPRRRATAPPDRERLLRSIKDLRCVSLGSALMPPVLMMCSEPRRRYPPWRTAMV